MGVPAEDFAARTSVPAAQGPIPGGGRCDVPDALLWPPSRPGGGCRRRSVHGGPIRGVRQEVEPRRRTSFCMLRSDTGGEARRMLGRYARRAGITRLRPRTGAGPSGCRPRSVGQQFLQEALLLQRRGGAAGRLSRARRALPRPSIPWRRVWSRCWSRSSRAYRKILICRPNAQFDQDIGFLPGQRAGEDLPAAAPGRWTIWRSCLDLEHAKEESGEEELRSRINYLFDTGVLTAEAMKFMASAVSTPASKR